MRAGTFAIVSLLVGACGSTSVRDQEPLSKKPGIRGSVRYQDGRPAAGVIVRVGEQRSGDQRATTVTDHDGGYGVNLPPGTYVMTAASDAGWIMLADASVGDTAPDLVLSKTCKPIRATVSPAVSDSIIAFTRLSEQMGDTFLASPHGGALAICLPLATYAVEMDGALRSAKVPLDATATSTISISAHRRTEVEAAYDGPTPSRHDLASFAAALAQDTTIVGLGEANHGTREFLELRLALSLELVRAHGFRTILLEAGYGEVLALDGYIHGADIDVAKAVQGLGYWMWDTEDFHAVLRALRAFNESAAPDARVSLMGIDVQDTALVVTEILKDPGLRLSNPEREVIQSLAESRGRAASKLAKDSLEQLIALLLEIQNGNRAHARSTTPLAARALRYRVIAITADLAESVRVRDIGMADMAMAILGSGAGNKEIIWAHNAHVAREADYGIMMMGNHLAASVGDRYFPVALLAGDGEARAWDAPGTVGVIPHRLPRLPAHYVEGAIASEEDNNPIFVLFDDSEEFARWLRIPRYVREFGSAIDDKPKMRDMRAAFRAVAFVPHAHATSPTPTGIRKASP